MSDGRPDVPAAAGDPVGRHRAEGTAGSVAGRRLTQLARLPVDVLEGVGAKSRQKLAEIEVETIFDLLGTYPRRYIDRTRQADLADLAVGDEAVVLATVRHARARRTRRGRAIVELDVHDGTGGMHVVFFNQPWRARQLPVGSEALFFGKLDTYRARRQMTNPVVDLVSRVEGEEPASVRMGRIVPVYPASTKAELSSWEVGGFVAEALQRAGRFADPLPSAHRHRLRLVDRTTAYNDIHRPDRTEDAEWARRRLAFDELFRLQLAVVLRRRALARDARGIRHDVRPGPLPAIRGTAARGTGAEDAAARGTGAEDAAARGTGAEDAAARGTGARPTGAAGTAARPTAPASPAQGILPVGRDDLVDRLVAGLPFPLTGAQRRATGEIFTDMASPLPMHRLLQGDVGSGKTVVAVGAMVGAVQGGHQGALMVPTEVLAEQHHGVVTRLVGGLSVPDPGRLGGARPLDVSLLTGRTPAGERARVVHGLLEGTVDLVVGTHALLTDDVRFRSLGVVVIDEQHRFGVEQRAALREKAGEGRDPDLLVMTATPIPRTAAMVVFGDLDMTVLDELPPGRNPVATQWARTPLEELAAWDRVRREVAAGRRAYVVCPLVEGSEKVQARSAVEERDRLAAEVLPGLALGLVHGQLGSSEKEGAMAAFRRGDTPVLVATTVIEVGVDVPEATVMVVEDADHFGIAQLHQLRGRVGRGGEQSWCFLLSHQASADAAERLSALESTTDGFELAEVDLELRGEGSILGARQKGRSDLRLAKLRRDRELLASARRVADAIVTEDPGLAEHRLLADELHLFLDEEEEAFLFKS